MIRPLPRDGVPPLECRIWLGAGGIYHQIGALNLPRSVLKELVKAVQEKLIDYPEHVGAVYVQLPTEEAPKVNV